MASESRKYATAAVIFRQLLKADGTGYATGTDWSPAAGDVKRSLSTDGVTALGSLDVATLPTYSNGWWLFPLSAAELTSKFTNVKIEDAALKSDAFTVDTFGNAAAFTPDDVSTPAPAPLDAAGTRAALGLAAANLDTQLGAIVTSIINKVRKFVQLVVRSDAAVATDNATELTEINASGGSGAGAYVSTTDALQALRDRGDAAWVTGSGGGGGLDAAATRAALGMAAANLDAQLATKPNAAAAAAAVIAAAAATPIAAKVKIVNETPIQGTGTALDPMRPA